VSFAKDRRDGHLQVERAENVPLERGESGVIARLDPPGTPKSGGGVEMAWHTHRETPTAYPFTFEPGPPDSPPKKIIIRTSKNRGPQDIGHERDTRVS
jgi:hypothetical protein